MKDNNLNLLNKIIIATVILLLVVVIYVNSKNSEDDYGDYVTEETIVTAGPTPEEVASTAPVAIRKEVNSKIATKLYKKSIGFDATKYNEILNHKKLIHEFKSKIKLDVKLPTTMKFVEMNMEDNIAGLYGTSEDGKKQMAILATEGKVKTSDAIEYLKDAGRAFPLLSGHQIQADKISTLKAPESTGLGEIRVIPTSDVNGRAAYGALIDRQDGKGTYLFMMEAPREFFDSSEGSLDFMLESAKIKP